MAGRIPMAVMVVVVLVVSGSARVHATATERTKIQDVVRELEVENAGHRRQMAYYDRLWKFYEKRPDEKAFARIEAGRTAELERHEKAVEALRRKDPQAFTRLQKKLEEQREARKRPQSTKERDEKAPSRPRGDDDDDDDDDEEDAGDDDDD